jgi:hypothetical protein
LHRNNKEENPPYLSYEYVLTEGRTIVLPLSLYQAKDGFRIGGSIGGTLIPIPLLSLTYRLQ